MLTITSSTHTNGRLLRSWGIHVTLVKWTYQCNLTLEFKERETTRGNSNSLMQCIFQQFELRSIKRASLLIIIVSAGERLVFYLLFAFKSSDDWLTQYVTIITYYSKYGNDCCKIFWHNQILRSQLFPFKCF